MDATTFSAADIPKLLDQLRRERFYGRVSFGLSVPQADNFLNP